MNEDKKDAEDILKEGEFVFDLPIGGASIRASDPECEPCYCVPNVTFTGNGVAYANATSTVENIGCNVKNYPCTGSFSSVCPDGSASWKVTGTFDWRYVTARRTGGASYDGGDFVEWGICRAKCPEPAPNVEINFNLQWERISASIIGNGEVSISGTNYDESDSSLFLIDTAVTMTATHNECWEFDHWEYSSGSFESDPHGINGSTNPSVTITTLPRYKTSNGIIEHVHSYYKAVFTQKKYRLITKPNIEGALLTEWDLYLNCGSTFTITATSSDDCAYVFEKWSDGVETSRREIIMDRDITLTAIFKRVQYSLTVTNSTGHGTYTVSPSKEYYYKGDKVTVYAHPDSCYKALYKEQEVEFYCADISVDVSFYKTRFSLTVSETGSGEVLIDGSIIPAGTWTFYCGDITTLTAVPDHCWKFSHWSGDVSGSNKTVSITMDGDKSVSAVFVACKEDNRIIECNGNVIFDTCSGNPVYQVCDCS